MISSVGRKLRRIVPRTELPEDGADALITTWCSVSSSVTAVLSMNEGTSVLKSWLTLTGSPPPGGVYVASFFSVPSIESEVELISRTLSALTCSTKNGW